MARRRPAPKFHLPKSKCRRTVAPKSDFAPGSFRYIKLANGAVMIGCPKGKWNSKSRRCKVGTRAHEIILGSKGGKCKVSYKRAF